MKKKLIASITCLSLLLVMLLSSTLAWFTDQTDAVNNTMTVGNVSIKQFEKDRDGNDFKQNQALFPAVITNGPVVDADGFWTGINNAVDKVVTVENVGSYPAYVRTVFAFEMMKVVTTDGNGKEIISWDNPLDEGADAEVFLNDDQHIEIMDQVVIYRYVIPGENGGEKFIYLGENLGTPDAAFVIGIATYAAPLQAGDTTKPSLRQFYLAEKVGNEFFDAVDQKYEILVLSQAVQSAGFEQLGSAVAFEKSFLEVTSNRAAEWFGGGEWIAGADLPTYGVGSGEGLDAGNNVSAYEIRVHDMNTGDTIGNVTVHPQDMTGSIDDVEVIISEASEVYEGLNITFENGEKAVTYNISVTGMKDNISDTKVKLKPMTGYNKATVYHYEQQIAVVSYNEGERFIEFLTNGFSPFTVVYSNVEETLPIGMPVAIVTDVDEYENTKLEWGQYGDWSPSNPENQTLYAAYLFKAPHDSETVESCAFKDWTCDYYVSIDRDIEEGVIFLGGNYGSFGWVGFENPIAIGANEEIPLLGSVAGDPWTYEDIASFVGEFICGVAETYGHEGELAGATFTVKLRLTNPENEADYYDVNTVKYTFAGTSGTENNG